MTGAISRRQFVVASGIAAFAPGALARSKKQAPSSRRDAAQPGEGTWKSFPILEARGGPAEIGEAIGAATKERLAICLERRRAWFEELKAFALADRGTRLDGFAKAAEARHPEVMAEIRGMARGAGRELDDLLVLNFHPELAAMKAEATCGDCSTLHLVQGGRVILAHNEDDDDAYRDQMVLLRVQPHGKPAFTSLAYPGATPGNVPAMSSAGLVRSTNFIAAKEVRPGVPRYVLGRAMLGASTIEEAVRIAAAKDSAYSFHVNLGSTKDRKLYSLEVGPGGLSDRRESNGGIYLHTNHFVLPATKGIPQQVYPSSESRYQVLSKALASAPPIERVGVDDLVRWLSSHEAVTKPYSPCRHPDGTVRGRTVALALFDVAAGTFTLYEGNPCEGRKRLLT